MTWSLRLRGRSCEGAAICSALMVTWLSCSLSCGAESIDIPPVIGILATFSEIGEATTVEDNEGHDICHMLPLGIYENKKWGRECVDSQISWKDLKLKVEPECEARLAELADTTFFVANTDGVDFKTTTQCRWQIVGSLFPGFCGRCPDAGMADESVLVVVNRKQEWDIAPPAQVKISSESLTSNALAAVEKDRMEPWTVESPGFDALKYQPLEIIESKAFRMTPTKNAAWIHAMLPYPAELAPMSQDDPTFPTWSGEYFALVELSDVARPRILWEDGYFLDDYWTRHYMELLGTCDGDGDGAAEVVLVTGAHEYREFRLLAIQDNHYRTVSNAGGSL